MLTIAPEAISAAMDIADSAAAMPAVSALFARDDWLRADVAKMLYASCRHFDI